MNRRQFLQSLTALGFSVALPEGTLLANASKSVVDQAWQSAIQNPLTFYVSSWGTLSYSATENETQTLGELLGLAPVRDRDELLALTHEQGRVEYLLENEWLERTGDEESDEPDWQSWLAKESAETVEEFIVIANSWIDHDADETDWEIADIRGYSDRGAAKSFFEFDFGFSDDFNVVIVDGDHPGSSYFAAELRMDVDDANALALEMDLPIRFEWSGD